MLVFKDSILGFVAGVQLSANDMLRIGDWIALRWRCQWSCRGDYAEHGQDTQLGRNHLDRTTVYPGEQLFSELARHAGKWRATGKQEYLSGYDYPEVLHSGNAG